MPLRLFIFLKPFSKHLKTSKHINRFLPELRDFDPQRVRSARDFMSSPNQIKITKTFSLFFLSK
jgi:hypothetical protein